jgi:hypothetical protein
MKPRSLYSNEVVSFSVPIKKKVFTVSLIQGIGRNNWLWHNIDLISWIFATIAFFSIKTTSQPSQPNGYTTPQTQLSALIVENL